jgi:hypothetical protein
LPEAKPPLAAVNTTVCFALPFPYMGNLLRLSIRQTDPGGTSVGTATLYKSKLPYPPGDPAVAAPGINPEPYQVVQVSPLTGATAIEATIDPDGIPYQNMDGTIASAQYFLYLLLAGITGNTHWEVVLEAEIPA